VDLSLLIEQVDHGPGGGMAVVHLALVALVAVGGLLFVVLRGRRASDGDGASDRDPGRRGRPET
jgi:hypothetical protein